MQTAQLSTDDQPIWSLSGVLTVHNTATRLLEQVQTAMQKNLPNCLDLKAVEQVDSAGLALLIEIIRLCHAKKCHIKMLNSSEQLRRLASAHDVEDFLSEEPV